MTEQVTSTTYMRPSTREKFWKIAAADKRSLVDTLDIVADEAMKSRGIDQRKIKTRRAKSAR